MLQSSKQKFLSFQEKAVTFATETALMINNQIIYCRYENLFSFDFSNYSMSFV